MEPTHLHLALTHFPIVGTLIGLVILVYGLLSKNHAVQKVALVCFVCMSLISIPVFLSGEEAEETIEKLNVVSHDVIHEHEELAEKAIWLMALLGVLSVFNLLVLIKNKSTAKVITMLTLVVSMATFGTFTAVGNLGGEIRHSEIRDADSANDADAEDDEEEEEDDDD